MSLLAADLPHNSSWDETSTQQQARDRRPPIATSAAAAAVATAAVTDAKGRLLLPWPKLAVAALYLREMFSLLPQEDPLAARATDDSRASSSSGGGGGGDGATLTSGSVCEQAGNTTRSGGGGGGDYSAEVARILRLRYRVGFGDAEEEAADLLKSDRCAPIALLHAAAPPAGMNTPTSKAAAAAAAGGPADAKHVLTSAAHVSGGDDDISSGDGVGGEKKSSEEEVEPMHQRGAAVAAQLWGSSEEAGAGLAVFAERAAHLLAPQRSQTEAAAAEDGSSSSRSSRSPGPSAGASSDPETTHGSHAAAVRLINVVHYAERLLPWALGLRGDTAQQAPEAVRRQLPVAAFCLAGMLSPSSAAEGGHPSSNI